MAKLKLAAIPQCRVALCSSLSKAVGAKASPLALAAAGLRMLVLRGLMLPMIPAPKETCS